MDGWEVKVYNTSNFIQSLSLNIHPHPQPHSHPHPYPHPQGGVQQELLKDQLLQWTHTGECFEYSTHFSSTKSPTILNDYNSKTLQANSGNEFLIANEAWSGKSV